MRQSTATGMHARLAHGKWTEELSMALPRSDKRHDIAQASMRITPFTQNPTQLPCAPVSFKKVPVPWRLARPALKHQLQARWMRDGLDSNEPDSSVPAVLSRKEVCCTRRTNKCVELSASNRVRTQTVSARNAGSPGSARPARAVGREALANQQGMIFTLCMARIPGAMYSTPAPTRREAGHNRRPGARGRH